jgi:phospholipase/lecithinase/hemolysin
MRKTQMKRTSANGWLSIACLALALAAPEWAAAKPPSGQLVVFGTSLSDPGNAFALRGGTNTPPDYSVDPFLVPDRPYAKGGHHFSNGATWIEQYAKSRGLATSAQPAFRSSNPKAANFAVGGARARDEGEAHLAFQVNAFLSKVGRIAANDALYVIEMGSNDLRDALEAGGDFGIIFDAIAAISANIRELYDAGARNFLVWNAPDLGLTPAIRSIEPDATGIARIFSQLFNDSLDFERQLLTNDLTLDGIAITLFDVFGKLDDIVANPQDFGLTNVTEACITPSAPPFACKKPDEYLFWDGIHPTRAMHAIIANEAAMLLLP